MQKIRVEYQAGQSRYSAEGVDYMLANADGTELYAELPPVDGDETGTYDDLQVEIMRQAVAEGVDVRRLEWPYGEPLLTVTQVADILDLSETRIRQLCAAGRLGRKVGRDWVIDVESLAAEQDRQPAGRPARMEPEEALDTIIIGLADAEYTVDGTDYAFEVWGHPNGARALVATYTQSGSGESHSIWTAEAEEAPASQAEAEDYIRRLDWAIEDMGSLRREGFRPQ